MTKDEALKLALEAFKEINYDQAYAAEITAIREALALSESSTKCEETSHAQPDVDRRSTESKETFDQQEPMAYDKTELNCFAQDLYDQKMREGKRGHYESMFHVIHQCIEKVAPPHRKPLTDEEIKRMAAKWFLSMYWPLCNTFARAIEAAHGIKE